MLFQRLKNSYQTNQESQQIRNKVSWLSIFLLFILISSCATIKKVPLGEVESFQEVKSFCLDAVGRGQISYSGKKSVFSFESQRTTQSEDLEAKENPNEKLSFEYRIQLLFPFQSPVLWSFKTSENGKSFSGSVMDNLKSTDRLTKEEKNTFDEAFEFLSDVILLSQANEDSMCERQTQKLGTKITCEDQRPLLFVRNGEKIQIIQEKDKEQNVFFSLELSNKVTVDEQKPFFKKAILSAVRGQESVGMNLIFQECR